MAVAKDALFHIIILGIHAPFIIDGPVQKLGDNE